MCDQCTMMTSQISQYSLYIWKKNISLKLVLSKCYMPLRCALLFQRRTIFFAFYRSSTNAMQWPPIKFNPIFLSVLKNRNLMVNHYLPFQNIYMHIFRSCTWWSLPVVILLPSVTLFVWTCYLYGKKSPETF